MEYYMFIVENGKYIENDKENTYHSFPHHKGYLKLILESYCTYFVT